LEQKTVDLSKTGILVLDEADRMLDMGFAPQIKKILEKVPKARQTLLFSATMPNEIVKIANSYMKTPLRIEVAPAGTAVNSVTQEIYFLERGEKLSLLKELLRKFNGSVLVFSRTKYGAKKIARDVRNMGFTATEIHSNRSLNQRLEALKGFKLGTYRILVATDIAARGIDVTGIELVVNYDLPDQAEDYVHRIGRTGRASMTGHAISFATHDQKRDVQMIERLIRKTLPVATLPKLERLASITPPRPPLPPRGGQRGSQRPAHGSRNSGSRPSKSRSSYTPRTSGTAPSRSKPYSPSRPHAASHARPGDSNSGHSGKRKRYSDYERGRKPAPQSLKKISQASNGFFLSRKAYSDEE
jgi:ATP-dependent RNA helicase RhlE